MSTHVLAITRDKPSETPSQLERSHRRQEASRKFLTNEIDIVELEAEERANAPDFFAMARDIGASYHSEESSEQSISGSAHSAAKRLVQIRPTLRDRIVRVLFGVGP